MSDHCSARGNNMPRNARNIAICKRHAIEANVYATHHGIMLKIAYPCAFQPMVNADWAAGIRHRTDRCVSLWRNLVRRHSPRESLANMPFKSPDPIRIGLFGVDNVLIEASPLPDCSRSRGDETRFGMTNLRAFQAPLDSSELQIRFNSAQYSAFLFDLFDGKLSVK